MFKKKILSFNKFLPCFRVFGFYLNSIVRPHCNPRLLLTLTEQHAEWCSFMWDSWRRKFCFMCLWFFYFGWDKSFFVMSYYYHSSWMAYLVWTVSNWLIPFPIGYYHQTHHYKQSTKIYHRCPFHKRRLHGWQNCFTFLSLFFRFLVYSRKLLVRGERNQRWWW